MHSGRKTEAVVGARHCDVLGTRVCVCLSSRSPWLHMLLAGHVHRSQYHGAILNFVRDCRMAFRCQTKQDTMIVGHEEPEDGPASSQGGPQGRAAIFDGDSESDEAPVERRGKRSRGGVTAKASFRSIVVRELTIKCSCGPGPRLLIPVDTGDLERIVQHLHSRAGEQPESDCVFLRMLSDVEIKIIVWKNQPASSQEPTSTVGSWQIIYHTDAGQTKRTSAGLQVPAVDLAGERLNAVGVRDAAKQVLVKARRLWNQVDRSDRPRLPDEVVL
jgi:hypothetical protein